MYVHVTHFDYIRIITGGIFFFFLYIDDALHVGQVLPSIPNAVIEGSVMFPRCVLLLTSEETAVVVRHSHV